MAKASNKPKSVVEHNVKFENEANPVDSTQGIFDEGSEKVVKSIGYTKIPGKNQYISYVIYTKGLQVIKVEVDEPDLRAIAEDNSKAAFVNTFMADEE